MVSLPYSYWIVALLIFALSFIVTYSKIITKPFVILLIFFHLMPMNKDNTILYIDFNGAMVGRLMNYNMYEENLRHFVRWAALYLRVGSNPVQKFFILYY